MTGIFGETLSFGQENGPDVELVVYGDEFYARYETQEGYPVVYDPDLGLFCYALLDEGSYVSSCIPIDRPPPQEAVPHVRESEEVRTAKAEARQAARMPPDEPEQTPPLLEQNNRQQLDSADDKEADQ